jgi:hypothetical protein
MCDLMYTAYGSLIKTNEKCVEKFSNFLAASRTLNSAVPPAEGMSGNLVVPSVPTTRANATSPSSAASGQLMTQPQTEMIMVQPQTVMSDMSTNNMNNAITGNLCIDMNTISRGNGVSEITKVCLNNEYFSRMSQGKKEELFRLLK